MTAGKAFTSLTTPLLFDACLSTGVEIRCAPPGGKPLVPHMKAAGRVLPARHAGSVDVFLEALGTAEGGDVLVIDNQGRKDEGCIGDLVTLEAQAAGLPVVAGRVRGVADVVRSGENGLLTPAGDDGAFAAAVSQLLDDHGLRARLGAAAAKTVEARHGIVAATAVLERALAIADAGT